MPAAGPLRAAGGHLSGDNTPTARRAPAQTPAPDTPSVTRAGSARAAPCRRPPDSDPDGSPT